MYDAESICSKHLGSNNVTSVTFELIIFKSCLKLGKQQQITFRLNHDNSHNLVLSQARNIHNLHVKKKACLATNYFVSYFINLTFNHTRQQQNFNFSHCLVSLSSSNSWQLFFGNSNWAGKIPILPNFPAKLGKSCQHFKKIQCIKIKMLKFHFIL